MHEIRRTLFALCLALAAGSAHAGLYTDELSKCLVESTDQADRTALVRWMFVSASAHPAVASISSATPKDLEVANETIGKLFMRLLTGTCVESTKKAIKYEGPAAIAGAFEVLGRVAGAELFSSPEVATAMTGLQKYVDEKQLEALGK